MPSDSYKIEVIHYLNPYLIWVEVLDTSSKKKTFEQIGIYGLLPHEITIDLENNGFLDVPCKSWAPASTNLMKEFLQGAFETRFSPIYIDRRSSVFKDNIHKYGEITIKTCDGELKKLSEWLTTTGFAEQNDCKFLNLLIAGKLQMKLEDSQLNQIYLNLENYCLKDDNYYMRENIEQSTKTSVNLDNSSSEISSNGYQKVTSAKKNNYLMDNFEEESVGRACHRRGNIEKNPQSDESFNVMKNYFDKMSTIKSSESEVSSAGTKNSNSGLPDLIQENTSTTKSKDVGCKEKATLSVIQRKFQLLKSISTKATVNLDSSNDDVCDGKQSNVSKESSNGSNYSPKDTPESMKMQDKQSHSIATKKEKTHSALQRKMEILKKASNKLATSEDTPNIGTWSDDEIVDVMNHINTVYPIKGNVRESVKDVKGSPNNLDIDRDIGDLGAFMCDFVEKLVTPVLMVHAKFNRVIKPVYSLREVAFNEHIHIVLRNMSVRRPMDVQSVSWHAILRGRSVFMISPKDSGKTMGYLPSVCRLITDGVPETDSVGPICIIVCATAESVSTVERVAKMLLGLSEKVVACYAGMDELFITTSLLNRCDLLICTPPALARLFQGTEFGVDLRRLRTFIMDDCERLDGVYKQEIKFFQYKIRELERSRVNRELRVQYVVASRVWCDFMDSLARKAPDTVVCIGSFCECVLYSKASMSVSFVAKTPKVDTVIDFLNDTDGSKKVVIVCRHNSDVDTLSRALGYLKRYIFVGNSDLTVSELFKMSSEWRDYNVPTFGPILICTDDTLSHVNITDAHYLVHYSLPNSFSLFRKRFSVLNDNYPSLFSSERETIKIKILLDNIDTEKLPKILNFIKRCTDCLPSSLDELSDAVLAKRDVVKAKKLVPICEALLSLGYCPDFHDCVNRHRVLKDFDAPSDWLPKTGVITFKILHYHTATSYSARLLTHVEKGQVKKFPKTYNTLSLKLGMYFGKASKLLGVPKVGDICAVSVKYNLFARCQVVKILNTYERGNPNYVLVKLLDDEKYERSRDIYLYHLPKEFRDVNTYVTQVRLANVQPKDKDVTFSTLALDHVKNLANSDDDIYLRSRIVGVIGNCIFVDTLEACQDLSSLDEVVVKYNLKQELLDKHAEINPDHMVKLRQLCEQNEVTMTVKHECSGIKMSKRQQANASWAHLDAEESAAVYVSSVISPDKCFIRLSKFEPCMSILLSDIKKYIASSPEPLKDVEIDDIILANFPEDDVYERARIDGIENDRIKCFFVDQGDWATVAQKDVLPITDKLITQLPFQSIECRLIGIKPPGNTWTDFCINWLVNYSDEGTKLLYAKYFTKNRAEITGGHKYAIVLIDTNTNSDIVVNQLMIDLNIAQKVEEEIEYLDKAVDTGSKETYDDSIDDDWNILSESPHSSSQDGVFQKVSLSKVFPDKPIRSVPLVESDCESETSDKWEVYKPEDFLCSFMPQLKPAKPKFELPAITANGVESDEVKPSTEDLNFEIIDQARKPKVIWRQNKMFVTLKIQLIGVEEYDLSIQDRAIQFSALLQDTRYSFSFELYAVVETAKCSHSNKGQYILVKLVKVLKKNWLTLTRDPAIKKWIVYDVDGLEASSDEERVDDSLVNIVREMHNKQDSESDDDDFVDDVNYKYK